ncbi:MAG: LysM domain-containing protein [Bacteriovorax sp.]|nr:LysM domain-containing protein [Bacteriovorax sp.]
MKILLSIIVFFSLQSSHAYLVDHVRQGDTSESIAKRNMHQVWIKYGEHYKDYEEDIKKWNPKITDWKNPPNDELLYVDFPYDYYVSGSTWNPSLGKYEEPTEFNQKLSLNAFYASSFGSYEEKTAEQTVNSDQNFPITLGLGFSTTNEQREHFIVGSVYWAQASKAKVSGNAASSTSDLSVPGELGYNLYYQYYMKENSLGIYSGYDYEKLNTLNTNEIIAGSPLVNIDNRVHYGTIGLTKSFSFFNLNMNLKSSVSKTLTSTTTGTKALTGYKYILYYTIKPEGRFSFNMFLKHHELEGPTKLSINRIGLSIGISIF